MFRDYRCKECGQSFGTRDDGSDEGRHRSLVLANEWAATHDCSEEGFLAWRESFAVRRAQREREILAAKKRLYTGD